MRILISLVALFLCSASVRAQTVTAPPSSAPTTMPTAVAQPIVRMMQVPSSDDVSVFGARVDGGTITIEVGYGCGCGAHDFTLVWDGGFAESFPVQTTLSLVHDAHGDSCEMACTDDLVFDLATLTEAYAEAYGGPGPITAHVAGHTVSIP